MDVMFCPECGAQNTPGAKFCSECGHKFEPEGNVCPKCGAPIDGNAKFCSICGTPTSSPAPAEERVENEMPYGVDIPKPLEGEKVIKDGVEFTRTKDGHLVREENGTVYVDAGSYFAANAAQKRQKEQAAAQPAPSPASEPDQPLWDPTAQQPAPQAQSAQQPVQAPSMPQQPPMQAQQPVPPHQQVPPTGAQAQPWGPDAGAVPPGAVPPGAMPQGAVPPGVYPNGAYPPGSVPPGAVPPGAVPPYWNPAWGQMGAAPVAGGFTGAYGVPTNGGAIPNIAPQQYAPAAGQSVYGTEAAEEPKVDPLSYLVDKKTGGIAKQGGQQVAPEAGTEMTAFGEVANRDGYYDDRHPLDEDTFFDERKKIQWVPLTLGIVGIIMFVVIAIQLNHFITG